MFDPNAPTTVLEREFRRGSSSNCRVFAKRAHRTSKGPATRNKIKNEHPRKYKRRIQTTRAQQQRIGSVS